MHSDLSLLIFRTLSIISGKFLLLSVVRRMYSSKEDLLDSMLSFMFLDSLRTESFLPGCHTSWASPSCRRQDVPAVKLSPPVDILASRFTCGGGSSSSYSTETKAADAAWEEEQEVEEETLWMLGSAQAVVMSPLKLLEMPGDVFLWINMHGH